MDYNAGYESYVTVVSCYNSRIIKVYSEGHDIIVEGGFVQARVVKPDIGVTNGYIHQIDAVFGIPTRDIPAMIFCKDWLRSTFVHLQSVGLDKYMKDPTLVKYQACTHSGVPTSGNSVPNNGVYSSNNSNQTDTKTELCGEGKSRCEFTFFVPNGTAIDDFAQTPEGRPMMNDSLRWRWLLLRLITSQEKIYIDQIPAGTNKSFVAVNGDELVVQVDSRSTVGKITGELPCNQQVHGTTGLILFHTLSPSYVYEYQQISDGKTQSIERDLLQIKFKKSDHTFEKTLTENS
jgi:hypothetical protein